MATTHVATTLKKTIRPLPTPDFAVLGLGAVYRDVRFNFGDIVFTFEGLEGSRRERWPLFDTFIE